MDIHRCRFVPYPPQPINGLAFSHPSDITQSTPSDLRLALGRNNGDLEIWNPLQGKWAQEVVLKGTKNTTIEQLAWTQDITSSSHSTESPFTQGPLRLFSTGGSTAITEWDLNTGAPKRQVDGNTGDIWCFAAQPQIKNPKDDEELENGEGSQLLAAGCGNGSIILFSTTDDDVRYIRTLPTPASSKPKVLSLTWRDRKTIVAGYDDSTLRVFDVPSRSIIRNMSLGKPVDGNETVAWTVKCLPDGTILSGDSTGELKIWNSRNYSLLQRLKTHEADILDIATNAKGDMIFTMGVDRRTVAYKPVTSVPNAKTSRWAEVSHKRYHKHDVKCSATFESKDLSVLVSGGIDAIPIVIPIRRFQSENHRSLAHLPQRPQISASRPSRVFISWWDREIAVYHVSKNRHLENSNTDFDSPDETPYQTLTRLALQGNESLQDAQISDKGDMIVATTIKRIKLFQLRKTFAGGVPTLRTRQIELPASITQLGGRRAGFSPDGKWLFIIRKENTIVLAKISAPDDSREQPLIHPKITKLYRAPRSRQQAALSSYPETITQVAFSSDSRVLAVGDLSGSVDTWVLEGHEDTNFIETASDHSDSASESSSNSSDEDDLDQAPIVHGQKWIRNPSGSSLPKLDSAIQVLTFRPCSTTSSTTASPHVDGNLGLHATRHNPHPISHELPKVDHKLIALTATHKLTEFDVLTSRLSDWSRRNPSQYLPETFKNQTHRVIGCFWDVTDPANRGERLWLYGHNYLFMLDISRDFPRPSASAPKGITFQNTIGDHQGKLGQYDVLEPTEDESVQGTTKKQTNLEGTESQALQLQSRPQHQITSPAKKRKRKHPTTGAGGEMKPWERPTGIGNLVHKFKNTGQNLETVDMDDEEEEASADRYENGGFNNGSDEQFQENALVRLRRKDTDNGDGENDGDAMDVDTAPTSESRALLEVQNPFPRPSRPHSYYTYAYNSILGIGVLGPSSPSPSPATQTSKQDLTSAATAVDSITTTAATNLEIVIVERSIWDVEQVPRFDGGDWGS